MPQRLQSALDDLLLIVGLAIFGAVIGMGQALASGAPITWRVAIGKAICVGGLTVAALSARVWFPDLSIGTIGGIGAMLASLGTSGLERLAARVFARGGP